MSALWVCVESPLRRGGQQVTSENVRLAAKPQMGRGLGTAETKSRCRVLMAGFSWQGSHGPGGLQFQSIIAIFFKCLKGGHYRRFFFFSFVAVVRRL